MKIPKKKLLIIFLIILPSVLPFFNAKFFYTQDYIYIARLNQMSAALLDGNFPVRWSPDLRFGEPLYNFYAPLPYYIGGVIGLTGIDFIWVAKILFILSSFLSALTMYILCRKLFSPKAAILASVLYTYAPYRAVDIYVRGALSETWAFVFFPLIFYCSILVSEKTNFRRMTYLALSLAGLFLTHNVTALMFSPFLAFFWLYLTFKTKNWKIVLYFTGSLFFGLGISAFFILPALFEKSFIQTKYLLEGYFNYRAHFVAIFQFFSLFWGYGSSLWGIDDGMSFQVGLTNWVSLVLAAITGFVYRKDKKLLGLLLLLVSSFMFSLFMQHNRSAFIWEAIPILGFIQFPWRFLSISIFIISLIGAVLADKLQGKFKPIYIILILLTIIINFQFFRPEKYLENNFFDKFLNKETMKKGVDLTKDYLPIWVEDTDINYFEVPRARMGSIRVLNFSKKTGKAKASIKALSDSIIEAPITYFPGWEVVVDGKKVDSGPSYKTGLITFKVSGGIHEIIFDFKDTLVRTTGNVVSLASLAVLFVLWKIKKITKNE